MKCNRCKEHVTNVSIWSLIGPICKPCEETGIPDKLSKRVTKYIVDKKIASYPNDMDARDFDRLALQVAMMYLMQSEFRENMRKNNVNPMLFMPNQFALTIKEQIIDQLPSSVVSTSVNSGMDRWSSGGTYCLVNDTIPKALILDRLEKLDIPFPSFLQEAA